MTRPFENIAAEIPADLQMADQLLTRFGRWAMHRHKKQRCASAEGAYVTPPNDDDRQPRAIQMPVADAMAVQRALAQVPERERIVLEILYVPRRWPVEAQLRRLRIPPRLCRERHALGLRMFWNRWRVASGTDAATLAAT